MKVLVIQQKMIGDVLTSTILLEALRKKFPESELHYLVNSHTQPVLENNPVVNKLVLFSPEMQHSKKAFLKLLKQLRNENYNAVIDVYSKTGSALMTWYTKAPIRIGIRKSYLRLFYTHTFSNKSDHGGIIPLAYKNRLQLLQPLDISIDESLTPQIYITDEERTFVKKALLKQGLSVEKNIYIMVNILGSSVDKTYPPQYMAQLLNATTKQFPGFYFLLNYMPNQSQEVKKILDLCHEETKKQLKELHIKGLRNFIIATSFCKAVIGNEGGAIHMGAALNLPTFAIFSPWIRKEIWSLAFSSNPHVSVHLKDYQPGLFKNYDQKKFKNKQSKLYKAFHPDLMQQELSTFLKHIK